MTNHPRRPRDDDAPESVPPASAMPPAAQNGDHAFQPNAAQLIGQAVGQALAQSLPAALANVFSQVPVQAITRQHLCHLCLVERFGWESAHETEIRAAMKAAAEAAGFGPADPRAQQVDFGPFLPEPFRPGAGATAIPQMNEAVTTVQGSDVCQWHVPGVQARRGKLLVVPGGVNLAAFAAQSGMMRQSA